MQLRRTAQRYIVFPSLTVLLRRHSIPGRSASTRGVAKFYIINETRWIVSYRLWIDRHSFTLLDNEVYGDSRQPIVPMISVER